MTIKGIGAMLQNEKQGGVTSRFPCRAIMVRNVEEYRSLLSELKKITDIRMVRTSELFSSSDVMPKFENLIAPKYHEEWLILTGVSEYLRLFSKKEAADRRFFNLWTHQVPASSKGRIIIPLWGCEAQWFDSSLNLNGDERQLDFYYNCSGIETLEQEMDLLVLSAEFEPYKDHLEVAGTNLLEGLQSWFDYWTDPSPEKKKFVLLTKRCRSINSSNGLVSVRVVPDALSFVKARMDGAQCLNENNCTSDMVEELFGHAVQGKSLDKAILDVLNLYIFNGFDVMGKWKSMTIAHKHFVALWLQLHADNTYLSYCFSHSQCISDVLDNIMLSIFKVRLNKPEWIKEYSQLMTILPLKLDDRFFAELDNIPEFETRLDFISGHSKEERVYLLRMVGKWMRSDSEQVLASNKLKSVFPELYYYLCNSSFKVDDTISDYIGRYKAHKLENTLPVDEEAYRGNVDPECFDYRYSVMAEFMDDDTAILWIDALGVEWLSLLYWSLANNCEADIGSVSVTQANLPTETEYNALWNELSLPSKKLDKLDKLAHKGVVDEPDYYACIEEQFAFISSICSTVNDLLRDYHRVIVTGDHGTSRLAARFFHMREGIAVPDDATVYSHGRYCKLGKKDILLPQNTRKIKHSDGSIYVAFSSYDHFKKSGFAAGGDDDNAIYGEVHGGATPEELLVPVLVLNNKHSIHLAVAVENTTAKIRLRKVAFTLKFNKPVKSISATISGTAGSVSTDDNGVTWNVVFSGVKQGEYALEVCADNKMIKAPSVTVLSALGEEGDL